MSPLLKNAITSNLTLKLCSLIFGYCAWLFLSQSQVANITLPIPLYFYGSLENKIIHAQDTINVTLQTKRSELYLLDTQSLAIHINADKLPLGTKELLIKDKHILLPQTIRMVHCNPQKITITTALAHGQEKPSIGENIQ